ncbi:IS3 family transposase [Mucilaginibacter ginkgonis]|uniref:IS3 family transposase n=1 Tax=Mucilaginibacter ginkgonis TaxID=2682091 RepID=A0A6I4IMT0_9SPHI|nr:IS3 family transposase [Mucilaginibacter ginkgonis]QQL51517.1 IS3 family transposase [Mucilaginibacter ginkgonis]
MKVKGEASHLKYSEAFRRSVVAEYERGLLNKDQLQAKYGIKGNSRLLEWCRKYGKLHYPKAGALGRPMKDPQKQRIKDLEKELADTKLKLIAYQKLIEIAEQEEGISILKKGRSQTIKELARTYPRKVSTFCELFGYNKQSYYKAQTQYYSTENRQKQAKALVLGLRRQMPRLGTRKLHYLLKGELSIGRDKLFKLLRTEGLLVGKRRRYTVTTNSKHWMHKYPNLVKGTALTRPEQVWVADITYIDTSEDGHGYLHLITDAYSKQIMGYELCGNMEASSTLKALQMAIANRQYHSQALIHHSDRGLQYCSKLYTDHLKSNNISISMTENGNPYENAIAERVNGILKDEFGFSDQLNNISQAFKLAAQSVHIYNNNRPHLSCNMLTPAQMHQQNKIKLKSYNKKAQTSLVDV